METHSKNTGFGGLSRRRCLAIWNSAAWRASKGGKSENSIAWEAVTAGKSENSLAWEAPTGGKSENSLAWGAPTGGKSENSLAWGAPTGGKSENSLAWGAPTGGKSENSLAWGAPTGGKSENSLAWGGGKVKILSLGSPHGGKPPLAPLTDRNKPAVWAATPREAGWIIHRYATCYLAWRTTWRKPKGVGREKTPVAGDSHQAIFCASAFSCVLRSKTRPLLCHIVLLQFL